jgi:hypothetical protein
MVILHRQFASVSFALKRDILMYFAIHCLIAILLINEPKVFVKLDENPLIEPDLDLVRAESAT